MIFINLKFAKKLNNPGNPIKVIIIKFRIVYMVHRLTHEVKVNSFHVKAYAFAKDKTPFLFNISVDFQREVIPQETAFFVDAGRRL